MAYQEKRINVLAKDIDMNARIYASDGYKKWFQKTISKQTMKNNLAIDVIENGTIAVDVRGHGYGVFDKDGRFVRSSLRIRGRMGQIVPKMPHDAPYIDEDIVYFGNAYPHFGHFLLENMNRAWGCLADVARGAKIGLINNRQLPAIPGYMMTLTQKFGDVRVVSSSARFRRVIIPHQAFNMHWWSAPEFARAFAHIAAQVPGFEYEKIYVSRCKLKNGKTIGEEKIQHIFEKNGFHVIYPETLALDTQIGLMKNCRVLAGCAGTALHLSVFMPNGGRVIQIKRNRMYEDNADIQYLLNRTKEMESVFVDASIETVKTQHSTALPQIIGVNEHMKRFFDENGFEYDAADLAPDTDAMRQYADALAMYKKMHGGAVTGKIKHAVIKYTACLVPGRNRRKSFREFMKRALYCA